MPDTERFIHVFSLAARRAGYAAGHHPLVFPDHDQTAVVADSENTAERIHKALQTASG